jgi:hypothetical protein
MPITLRNKEGEEAIRRISRQTGEKPSAVISRLASIEEKRLAGERERRKQERLRRMDAFLDTLPVPTEEERKATWEALEDLYDENGLPK